MTFNFPFFLPKTLKLLLLLISLLLALSACSRNRANPPEEPVSASMPIGTITLVPVESPKALVTDNRGLPVLAFVWTGIANTIMDKGKSADFDAKYSDYRKQIGAKLTQRLQKELQAQGFQVRLADPNNIERNKDNVLNARKFEGHEAVLDLQIDEFAMYSGRTNMNYLPMINTSFALINPAARKGNLLDGWYSYGAMADKTVDGYILSDPKFVFPNFSSLMNQPALVVESFDEGLQKIVAHFIRDFRKEFRPKTLLAKQVAAHDASALGENAPSAGQRPKARKIPKRQLATPAPQPKG